LDINYSKVNDEIRKEAELLKNDNVNHPSHYTSGKIEVIDFIEDQKLNYHRGSVVKYVCRAGKKDPAKEIEDLRKAAWYANREAERLEKEGNADENK